MSQFLHTQFANAIITFNSMYKLPVADKPSLDQLGVPTVERLRAFKNILAEELNEIDEVIVSLTEKSPLDTLTMLADLFGDIQVYCASEMAKFGLPLDEILSIIMESNFSKLGEDGKPIYDERGKVQKDPFYWKPEPKIKQFLLNQMLSESEKIALEEARQLLDRHNRLVGSIS